MHWIFEARKYLDDKGLFPTSRNALIEYLENNLSERSDIPFELLHELRSLDVDGDEVVDSIDDLLYIPKRSDYEYDEYNEDE